MCASFRTRGDLRRTAAIGVLATVTMDCAFFAVARLRPGVLDPDEVGLDLIGRWAGGLAEGRLRHEDIACEPKVAGEIGIGLATHYLTGVGLTWSYHALPRRGTTERGMAAAIGWGVATGLLPCLILYPAYGYGCCARRTGKSTQIVGAMLLGHLAFGAGIGFWSRMLLRGR
jgi:Protein of unknown function (DUF2938)